MNVEQVVSGLNTCICKVRREAAGVECVGRIRFAREAAGVQCVGRIRFAREAAGVWCVGRIRFAREADTTILNSGATVWVVGEPRVSRLYLADPFPIQ